VPAFDLLLSPVIFCRRADIQSVIRQEVKAQGGRDSYVCSDSDECVKKLFETPLSLVVLDTEVGSESLNLVLSALHDRLKVNTRPILLISPEDNENLIGIAYEYGINYVLQGQISRNTIGKCLKDLITAEEIKDPIKETLSEVAILRDREEWSLATPILEKCVHENPTNSRIVIDLAENYIHEGAWDQALSCLQQFRDSESKEPRALSLLGRIYMHLGDFDGAIGVLSQAKILNPHNVDRLLRLGHALIGAEDYEEAMANFSEAMRIDKFREEAQQGKGKCLLMLGEINEGLALINAVSGPRELASIFNSAAIVCIRHKNLDQGMSLYRAALSVLKGNVVLSARLLFNMGLGYKKNRDLENANSCFAKAIEVDPHFHKAKQHLVMVKKILADAHATQSSSQGDSDQENELFEPEDLLN
jgi:tetratricopeptide (TPR) repeat protein